MGDIFDSTRRKISKHVSKEIAPEVFAERKAEFKAKVEAEVEAYLTGPKCAKRVQNLIEWEALAQLQKYFHSREFKNKCHEIAKGMVK